MSTRVVGIALLILISMGVFAMFALRSPPSEPLSETAGTVVLDEAKQEIIWDAEHITFELETYFGKQFTAALRDRDTASLESAFRPDSRTSIFVDEDFSTQTVGVVSRVQRERATETGPRHSVTDLVGHLMESTGVLSQIESIRLRVLQIKAALDEDGRWNTKLLLTAVGRDEQDAPISHRSEHVVSFRFEDQKISEAKAIVLDWEVCSEATSRAPHLLMEEATADYGLDALKLPDNWKLAVSQVNKYNFQFAVEDFDRDGYLDIAIAPHDRRPILLRSEQGTRFAEVEVGLKAWSADSTLATWIDYDNDGFPDLLMGDRLYRNMQGKRFEDVTRISGIQVSYDPMGCAVADFDCDGWLDMYILYHHSGAIKNVPWVGDSQSGELNQLWRNEGNGTFKNVSGTAKSGGGYRSSFAASWLFLNDDPLPDLYVANDFGENVLLQNTGSGTFLDVTAAMEVGDFATSMGVAAGDVDNDGSPEIYVANMYSKMGRRIIGHVREEDYPGDIYQQIKGACAGNRLYSRKSQDSAFKEISVDAGVNEVGWAYGPSFVDLNNDGWLDIYATTGYLSFDRKKPDG